MERESLVGLLLDVSGSMKKNAVGSVQEESEWIRSVLQVADDVIGHDVQEKNHLFTIGIGGQSNDGTFDILKAIKKTETEKKQLDNDRCPVSHSTMNYIFNILELHGAIYLRKWTTVEKVIQYSNLKQSEAELIISELRKDSKVAERVVNSSLHPACRQVAERVDYSSLHPACRGILVPHSRSDPFWRTLFNDLAVSFKSSFVQATAHDIKNAVDSALNIIKTDCKLDLPPVDYKFDLPPVDIYNATENYKAAAKTLRGALKTDTLTDQRRQELFDIVKPFIYGGTPMVQALNLASKIFQRARSHVEKLMIVISDGEWDKSRLDSTFEDVTIVCCFVSQSSNITPRQLFDDKSLRFNWEIGANNMFELSSKVSSQLLPRAMLIQNGWKFDIEENNTKLFAHVNKPEHMRDICKLGKKIACSQECLSEYLVSVSLDMYINQSNTGFNARQQVGGTCYANAAATAIHLSMKRILGRDEGYPDFKSLREELIREHGFHGADTFRVMRTVCPRYRLQCSEININKVFRAIVAKRIVVARFKLTDREWDVFGAFYRSNPKGILTKQQIDRRHRPDGEPLSGHAVVVTSYTNDCLILMNSWGDGWADKGFFRVESADVLDLAFMDVYWYESDLSPSETSYYKTHGSEVARKLMSMLRGLQVQTYECPLCKTTSPINSFSGTLSNVTCPSCRAGFPCSEAGNILAMNIYLTSIATYSLS